MAISWELEIIPLSVSAKTASIVATRTDDIDPDNIISMVYEVAKATIDTEIFANNIPILDEIWAKHQARLTKDDAIDDFVSSLESLGKTNLEGRE